MSITLNGKPTEVEPNSNITSILESLGLTGKPVVIEHNKTAIFPRDYSKTQLAENDQLEIISIAAGG